MNILMSMKPHDCITLAKHKFNFLVKKNFPRKVHMPTKVYVYCNDVKKLTNSEYDFIVSESEGRINSWKKNVIGYFLLDKIHSVHSELYKTTSYFWYITDIAVFNEPKNLNEFYNVKGEHITRPPCPWQYIDEKENI